VCELILFPKKISRVRTIERITCTKVVISAGHCETGALILKLTVRKNGGCIGQWYFRAACHGVCLQNRTDTRASICCDCCQEWLHCIRTASASMLQNRCMLAISLLWPTVVRNQKKIRFALSVRHKPIK